MRPSPHRTLDNQVYPVRRVGETTNGVLDDMGEVLFSIKSTNDFPPLQQEIGLPMDKEAHNFSFIDDYHNCSG